MRSPRSLRAVRWRSRCRSVPEFKVPSDAAVVLGSEDVAEVGKVRALTPTVEALAQACGRPVRTEVNVFGREEKVATVPFAAVVEAMRPAWRRDTRHQMELQSKRPMEELRDERGKRRKVWSIHARQVAESKRLLPAWRAGGRRLKVGPNGNLWRHLGRDRWEDTGRTCLTRPLFENDERKAPGVVIH